MRRRRLLLTIVLIVAVVGLALFVVVGIPLIQAMFTPPITGLPTAAASDGSNSLRARYTQTALAKTPGAITAATATGSP